MRPELLQVAVADVPVSLIVQDTIFMVPGLKGREQFGGYFFLTAYPQADSLTFLWAD